jgi:hypothetical protein
MNCWPFPGAIYLQTGQPCVWHFVADSFAEETPGRNGYAKSAAEPGRQTLSFHDQQCPEMTSHRFVALNNRFFSFRLPGGG